MKKIPFKSHEEWLKLRQVGLGGSDAYQIILNKFGSPFSVWLDKTGRAVGEREESVPMLHGNMVEPLIREWFCRETGLKVEKPDYILRSDEYPFMQASLDGIGVDQDGNDFILECKDTWSFDNENILSGGDLPEYWIIQLHHYFLVTGIKVAYVAYWFGNRVMEYQRIECDEELCDILLKKEIEFWKMVEDDVEPEIDNADTQTEQYVQQKFQNLIDQEIEREDLISIMQKQYELGQEISRLTQERKILTVKLQNEQGKFRKMSGGLYVAVNTRSPKIKKVFDVKAFQKENAELYDEYCSEVVKNTGGYTVKKIKGA